MTADFWKQFRLAEELEEIRTVRPSAFRALPPAPGEAEVVADVVFGSEGHLSVDDIAARLRERDERIGKATIYRTLDLLVRSRLVAEHDFGEGFKRYEHRLTSHPVHEHLICLECGKVGCCDNSPNRHATKHNQATGHPIIRSLEPGEDWYWCYEDEVAFEVSTG